MELNKIYNENCLDTMMRMPDKFVDLVVTSPPYNMRTRIRNGEYTTREKSEHFSKKYSHFGDDMPINVFYKFHKQVMSELLRVSKVVVYNFQIVTGSKEAFFFFFCHFNRAIKDMIVWDKGNGQPAMHEKVLNSCYELVLILENDNKAGRVIQCATFGRGLVNNIWRINKKHNNIKGHNAIMPDELAGRAIKYFSNESDLIYDPFMGSGTTAKMAVKLNRKFIGSEISKEYCELAKKRIKPYLQQGDLFYKAV